MGLAGGLLDGADAAEGGERGLAGQPLRVVAGGDEQGGGAVGSDADAVQKLRGAGGDGAVDAAVEFAPPRR